MTVRRSLIPALLALCLLAACSGGTSSTNNAPATTPTQNPSSISLSVTSSGATDTGPSAGGIGSSITLPAVTSGSGSTIAAAATTALPSGLPSPSAIERQPKSLGAGFQILMYLTMTPSANLSFTAFPGFTFNLTPAAGVNYFVGFYDPTNAAQGLTEIEGPGTTSGSSVSFQAKATALNMAAGQTYVFFLYTLPAPSASPTPSASPSPAPSSTATASPSPAPTQAPTASPAPSATPQSTTIVLSTKSLSFVGAGGTEVVTATEPNYSGAFTLTNNTCAGIVSVAQTTPGTFSVAQIGPGACSFGISDTNSQTATVSVSSTTTSIGGN